jgi:hypothetical protein
MTPRKGELIERALTQSIIGAFYDPIRAIRVPAVVGLRFQYDATVRDVQHASCGD